MLDWMKIHGVRIIIIFAIGLIIYFIFQNIVPRFIKRTIVLQMKGKPEVEIKKRSQTLSSVISKTIGIVIGILVLFTILAEIGINIGPALASLGIMGLAIGFGAQSLVKDLINGLFILIENQYGVGDVVKVAGIAGLVEEVNLRRTILRDLDGIVHYIPNSEITMSSNFTREYSRVNMNISVAYGENLEEAFENAAIAMFEAMTDASKIAQKLEDTVEVEGFDKKALLYNWLETLLVKFETTENLYSNFKVTIIQCTEESLRLKAKIYGEPFDPERQNGIIDEEVCGVIPHSHS